MDTNPSYWKRYFFTPAELLFSLIQRENISQATTRNFFSPNTFSNTRFDKKTQPNKSQLSKNFTPYTSLCWRLSGFSLCLGRFINKESFLHPRWKQPGQTAGFSPLSPSRAEVCALSQLCLTGRIHRNLFKNIPEQSSCGGTQEGSAISHSISSSGRRRLDFFFFFFFLPHF